MSNMSEITLALVKPDGVERGLVGEVISRIERKGYEIAALKIITATENILRLHYHDQVDKPYFPTMLEYMTEGNIVAIIARGENVVKGLRNLAGATKPTEALPGTIRGDFGRDWANDAVRNIVHTSDSPAHAEYEIGIWFKELDVKNV
jgi:nucleoside-diphosphate kinase